MIILFLKITIRIKPTSQQILKSWMTLNTAFAQRTTDVKKKLKTYVLILTFTCATRNSSRDELSRKNYESLTAFFHVFYMSLWDCDLSLFEAIIH